MFRFFKNIVSKNDNQECEALRRELDNMVLEYNRLKEAAVKLIAAQQELLDASAKLREENLILKQALSLTTNIDGMMQ